VGVNVGWIKIGGSVFVGIKAGRSRSSGVTVGTGPARAAVTVDRRDSTSTARGCSAKIISLTISKDMTGIENGKGSAR
jgi:hypothetical protein